MTAEKTFNIVFTVKNIVNPWMKGSWVGAQKAAAEYKGRVNISYSSPTKSDNIAEQTSQLEDIILKRPDAIVLLPVDYVALVPTVEKMNKAGIPVFNYSNELAGGKYEIYVGSNDEKLGYELASLPLQPLGIKGR